MSLLEHGKRIYLDETGVDTSDWVEVRQLSVAEVRSFRQRMSAVQPLADEGKDEAQGYEGTRIVCEECIVQWSEDAPLTPENVARLPYKLAVRVTVAAGLGGGEEEPPLTTGSESSDSSAGTPQQENPTNM